MDIDRATMAAMAVVLSMWQTLVSDLEALDAEDDADAEEEEDVAHLLCVMTLKAIRAAQLRLGRRWWALERRNTWFEEFVEWLPDDLFRRQLRVGKDLFEFMCQCAERSMQKQDTRFREAVPVKRQVAMALKRLGTGMSFEDVGSLFGHRGGRSRDTCRVPPPGPDVGPLRQTPWAP